MQYSLTKAALLATVLMLAPVAFAAPLNDTTAAAEAPNAAVPGHAHRGMTTPPPAAASGTKAENTPGSIDPGKNASASGMGTTDNTMSSSTGSEASRIGR